MHVELPLYHLHINFRIFCFTADWKSNFALYCLYFDFSGFVYLHLLFHLPIPMFKHTPVVKSKYVLGFMSDWDKPQSFFLFLKLCLFRRLHCFCCFHLSISCPDSPVFSRSQIFSCSVETSGDGEIKATLFHCTEFMRMN